MQGANRGTRRLRRWLLLVVLIELVAVPALLGLRQAVVPVQAWQERQWDPDDPDERPLRELLTRHARIRSPFYSFLVRPGDLIVEWSGHLTLEQPRSAELRITSGGATRVEVNGSPVLRSRQAGRWRSTIELRSGSNALRIRTAVPTRGGQFRGSLALAPDEVIELDRLPVTPQPAPTSVWERARAFQRYGDPLIIGLILLGLGLAAFLMRSGGFAERRVAEALAAVLVISVVLLLPHGRGLTFWGTALWSGIGFPWNVTVLLGGLLPWGFLAVTGRDRLRIGWLEPLRRPPVAAAAALGLTWLLRERRVWGDGWVTQLILEGRFAQGPFGSYFWKEPLDRLLAVIATRIAEGVGAGALEAVAFTSCLAGAWTAWLLARAGRRGQLSGWEAGAIWTAGAATLFFGHVENYTWVTAALVGFLLCALETEGGGRRTAATGLFAGLAVAFHPLAAFQVLPVLAVLFYRAVRDGARSGWLPAAARLGGGAMVVPMSMLIFAVVMGIEMPRLGLNRFAEDTAVLLGIDQAFSWNNLFSFVNRVVLIGSPGIGLALLAAATRRRDTRPGSVVLLAALGGAAVHLVFLNGKIEPVVLDWDLYAPAYVPLALIAGRCLSRADDSCTRVWATGLSAALLLIGLRG